MKIIQLSGPCETYGCLTEGEYPGMNTDEEMFFLEIHTSGEKWWWGYSFDILGEAWVYREPV